MSSNTDFPKWDSTKPAESLTQIYNWTISDAEGAAHWYAVNRRPKRLGSQSLRAVSILFAGGGALCPLIDATKAMDKMTIGQWGYVSLAVAAASLGKPLHDHYLHVRHICAQDGA